MNRDMRNHTHLVCEFGHELYWRGRWRHVLARFDHLPSAGVHAEYPRRYFKDAEIRRYSPIWSPIDNPNGESGR